LLNDYELASNILEEFCKTQQTKSIDFEQSELLLYQNMVYAEAGLYEKALKHLDENEKYIVDKLKLQEMRADCYYNLNKMDQATKLYEELLERNPDNLLYYKKLESCLNLSNMIRFK
jgi:peptide alpha-N-acetyltransferase